MRFFLKWAPASEYRIASLSLRLALLSAASGDEDDGVICEKTRNVAERQKVRTRMERLICGGDEEDRPLGRADNCVVAACILGAWGWCGKRESADGAVGVAVVVKKEGEEEDRGWRTGVISDRVAGRRWRDGFDVMRWRMECGDGDRGIKSEEETGVRKAGWMMADGGGGRRGEK